MESQEGHVVKRPEHAGDDRSDNFLNRVRGDHRKPSAFLLTGIRRLRARHRRDQTRANVIATVTNLGIQMSFRP